MLSNSILIILIVVDVASYLTSYTISYTALYVTLYITLYVVLWTVSIKTTNTFITLCKSSSLYTVHMFLVEREEKENCIFPY